MTDRIGRESLPHPHGRRRFMTAVADRWPALNCESDCQASKLWRITDSDLSPASTSLEVRDPQLTVAPPLRFGERQSVDPLSIAAPVVIIRSPASARTRRFSGHTPSPFAPRRDGHIQTLL